MDSMLSMYFLFEVIKFKYVWNTTDYINKYENGHWKWKVPWP